MKIQNTLVNTTLCYIEKDGCYLMLHRTKKENDYNKDKWIGIGGKFENGESPEDCAVREIREETGLEVAPKDLEYCGIVTFVDVSNINEGESLPPGLSPQTVFGTPPSPRGESPKTPGVYTEFMHIFRTRKFSGSLLTDCNEGELEWVPISKLKELPHWQADEIFYDFLAENHPFYSLKAVYKNNVLIKTWLNGKEYNHWESILS